MGLCVFSADRSHSGGSSKGERLSAKMRSLPVSSEPYETSGPKELGEKRSPSPPGEPPGLSVTFVPSAGPSAILPAGPSVVALPPLLFPLLFPLLSPPTGPLSPLLVPLPPLMFRTCRRLLCGPAGASDGATEDRSQEAGGGGRL